MVPMLSVIPVPEAEVATIVSWYTSAIDDDAENDLTRSKVSQVQSRVVMSAKQIVNKCSAGAL